MDDGESLRGLATPARAAAFWYTRLHSSDFSEEERGEFEQWLCSDPAHQVQFQHVIDAWDAVSALPERQVTRLGAPWSLWCQGEKALLRRSAWGYGLGLACCSIVYFLF